MNKTADMQPTVVRTDRGLSVAGTRITLCSIMDYIKADYPAVLIRDMFSLTDRQISDVMNYIKTHRPAVEAEYQLVLQQAEESRKYWENRNRDHFARIAAMPPRPGQEKIRTKLRTAKARLGMI